MERKKNIQVTYVAAIDGQVVSRTFNLLHNPNQSLFEQVKKKAAEEMGEPVQLLHLEGLRVA